MASKGSVPSCRARRCCLILLTASILLADKASAFRLPGSGWFGGGNSHISGLDKPMSAKKIAFMDAAKLTSLPTMPTHPHPHPRSPASESVTHTTFTIKRRQYVCKAKSAHDLLGRALERIGNSMFLNRERLDHFYGADKFDMEFAKKYLPPSWEAYTKTRETPVFDRCAVVGNSGHLTLSRYGRVINSFDAVIRTNQAPTKDYTHLVGKKTTFRLINRAMARRYLEALDSRYRRLKTAKLAVDAALEQAKSNRKRSPLGASGTQLIRRLGNSDALKRMGVTKDILRKIGTRSDRSVIEHLKSIVDGVSDEDIKVNGDRFPVEKNVTVVLVTEGTSLRAEMEQFIRSMRQLRPDVKVVIQTGKARRVIEEMLNVWAKRLQACWGIDTTQGHGNRATTGILATMTMLKQCNKVTLYGFGPPQNGTSAAPFHFYEGLMSRTYENFSKDVHNFSGEFRFLRKLRDEGRLQICTEADPRTCGYDEQQIQAIRKEAYRTGGSEEGPEEGEEEKEDDVEADGEALLDGMAGGETEGHIWEQAEDGEGAQF